MNIEHTPPPLRIVFADDHAVTRAGLIPFLEELAAKTEIYEAASFEEVMQQARIAGKPDLMIVDLKMPGMSGLAGLKTLRRRYPKVPLVVFSAFASRSDILQAMEIGADGFLPKTMNCEAMVSALRLVLAGERYIPSTAMSDSGRLAAAALGAVDDTAEPASLGTLTQREREIMSLLCDGASNKELARRLGIKDITVKTHLHNLYRKMGVANRSQAMKVALQLGLEQ